MPRISTPSQPQLAARFLLRESFREGGKDKKRTLLNLSDRLPTLVAGLRALLKRGTKLAPGDAPAILAAGHVAAVLGVLRASPSTLCSGWPASASALWCGR